MEKTIVNFHEELYITEIKNLTFNLLTYVYWVNTTVGINITSIFIEEVHTKPLNPTMIMQRYYLQA